ncbi:PAS domain S-box protein [Sulfurospirillum sp. 1307]|jgi:PAS domain S-box-containing protein
MKISKKISLLIFLVSIVPILFITYIYDQENEISDSFRINILIIILIITIMDFYIHKIITTLIKKEVRSKERYEMAIHGSKEGLWDWNLVTNEVYFSPQWKEMLGYKEYEIENSIEAWQKLVHPDDSQNVLETIDKMKIKKEKFYEHIHRLKRKDGSWVWNLDRGEIIYDEFGNPIRVIGFYTDITEQKNLEIQLKEAKKLFDLFMENSPFLVSIKNEKNEVLYANERLKRFLNHELVGVKTEDILDEKTAQKIQKLAKEALKNGNAENIVEYVRDGKTHYFRAYNFKIPLENRKDYIGSLYSDITEHYSLKKELEKKDELLLAQSRHAAMGEMISIIAHQWRQPISIINMAVNNTIVDIELESLDEKSLKEELESILKQTQYLSKTIDDFRNFFKPNKEKEYFYVKDIVDEMLNIIGKSLENNKIFICRENNEKSKIYSYSRELLQIFINIINNSKDAFNERNIKNRKIKIVTNEEDYFIHVNIIDNAGGIPEDILPNIFEPYFSTKKEEGTGIGLYMCKIIMEKHIKGSIRAFNVEDGACFHMKIPVD